jgi:hypothetical protein
VACADTGSPPLGVRALEVVRDGDDRVVLVLRAAGTGRVVGVPGEYGVCSNAGRFVVGTMSSMSSRNLAYRSLCRTSHASSSSV